MASARAAANYLKVPLYQYLNPKNEFLMPVPMMNILNGGSHAGNNVDIQEFMIYPFGAKSFSESLRMGTEIFHSLKLELSSRHLNTSVGDEGGFAPDLNTNEEAIEIILKAVKKAGYKAGKEIFIALDVAASELYNNNKYKLDSENKSFSSIEMINYLKTLSDKYPIISIEDGLDEKDWEGWKNLNKKLGDKIQIVGDDLTVTNVEHLQKAINEKAINSILIKLNQIGTVTETLEVIKFAHLAGFKTIISHRSGDTEDTFISDMAVGTNSNQIKSGSLSRSERVAKYNQLLRIEEELGNKSKMNKL